MDHSVFTGDKIRVMIVDDSAIVRGLLTRAVTEDGRMEVVASAGNGATALASVRNVAPQVILLDIEMPEMDGIAALPKLLEASPASHVIMVSTLTPRNAEISLRALALGASETIAKPSSREDQQAVKAFYKEVTDKIVALAARPKREKPGAPPTIVKASSGAAHAMPKHPVKALAIGASTGGPQALQVMLGALKSLPNHIPIFITQHMPATFTAILAEHLGKASGKPSSEGRDGEPVAGGRIYVAPGNYHMVPEKSPSDGIIIRLNQDPPENFCRPAVDPMLRGLSTIYGRNLLAAILTGMGSDGARGARAVTEAGGTVIAQDEATCVVWGMPRVVTEANLCRAVLPLDQIAGYVLRACGSV
jgi:two-component system chemotaxis response regulator CheB